MPVHPALHDRAQKSKMHEEEPGLRALLGVLQGLMERSHSLVEVGRQG